MRRRFAPVLLAFAIALGSVGGSTMVSAETAQDPVKEEYSVSGQNYVPGEAIVCYKAGAEEYSDQEEEKIKAETEDSLQEEKGVDSAEALLLVEDAGAVNEGSEDLAGPEDASEKDSFDGTTTDEGETGPGVITLVRSDHLTTDELIKELSAREDVLFVQPNYIYSSQSTDFSDQQWGPATNYGIGDDGWNTYDGGKPTPAVDTSKQVVAIMDSGVDYNHEDLKDHMWDEGLKYPALTAMGGGKYGYNGAFCNSMEQPYDTKDPMDDNGHGTHCAGIVAATWNGFGVSGVASGARIMAVKVANEKGDFPTDSVIRGYQYVIAAKKAGVNVTVTSNSYSGSIDDMINAAIIKEVEKYGIVCVYAAGNDSKDLNTYNSTSLFNTHSDNAIMVGANDITGNCADFSNFGTRDVDVFAPGVDIWSTVPMKKGAPTVSTEVLKLDGQAMEADYGNMTALSDTPLGFDLSGIKSSLQKAQDGKNVIHMQPMDEDEPDIDFYTGTFTDLSSCKGFYLECFSGQAADLTLTVSEVDEDGEESAIKILEKGIKKGFNSYGIVYPDDPYIFKKKNIKIKFSFGISGKETEGMVRELDLRCIRFTADTENYEKWDGTSMATPMVAGGVAVLAAAFPKDSAAKLAARVRGSVLPTDPLKDKCLSGGIFRLDKALAGNTVPVPQSAEVEGELVVVHGYFFGATGTMTVNGSKAEIRSWTDEKIVAKLPADYKAGENRVEVTSSKGSGHVYLKLGNSSGMYERLALPGSTIDASGDYRISDAALEKYADFYQGTIQSMTVVDGAIYVVVARLNEGTAIYKYLYKKNSWEEVYTDSSYTPDAGAAAWNGNLIIHGSNPKGNKTAIGLFDPVKKELRWTMYRDFTSETGVKMVNNGYGIFLVGGSESIYGNPKNSAHITAIRKLDPVTMKVTEIDAEGASLDGMNPFISSDENGTLYSVTGKKIAGSGEMFLNILTFNGDRFVKLDSLEGGEVFEGIDEGVYSECNGVATKNGILMFGPFITDEKGAVITDSYLLSYDGSKLTKQNKILSFRPVYNIVTVGCDGICFVLGATMAERNNLVFSAIPADAKSQFGDKKLSNEWSDGICYGKNGFRSLTHPNKAVWKKNKTGWWYEDTSGWYPKNCWQKIDGKWYYFDSKGYMESDAYRGGYYVAKSGAYDDKGKAQWKKDKKGWWYQLPDGKYLKNCWKKINGKWYYFKSNGYAAANEWVKGYYWLNKDCAWIYQPKGKWKKDKKGWWFGDTSGWYAKKGTYTINGKAYQFDKQGYCINP